MTVMVLVELHVDPAATSLVVMDHPVALALPADLGDKAMAELELLIDQIYSPEALLVMLLVKKLSKLTSHPCKYNWI